MNVFREKSVFYYNNRHWKVTHNPYDNPSYKVMLDVTARENNSHAYCRHGIYIFASLLVVTLVFMCLIGFWKSLAVFL